MPKRLCVKLDYPKCGQTEVWWFITLPPSHQSLRPLPAPRPTSVAEVRVMGVGDRWGISHVIPVLKGVSPSPLRLTGTIPFPSLGWNEWTPFLGAPLFHMKFQTCSKCMVRYDKQSWQSKVLKYLSVCRSYHLQMILGMNMEMFGLFGDHFVSWLHSSDPTFKSQSGHFQICWVHKTLLETVLLNCPVSHPSDRDKTRIKSSLDGSKMSPMLHSGAL